MGRPPGIRFHVAVAMRLEKELAEALERVAKEEERPMGSMARILVREAIEAREREAIADRKAAEVWNKVGKKTKEKPS